MIVVIVINISQTVFSLYRKDKQATQARISNIVLYTVRKPDTTCTSLLANIFDVDVPMKLKKYIAAFLIGFSKLRRMVFSFLEYLFSF